MEFDFAGLVSQAGFSGIILIGAYKVVSKLYGDMKEDMRLEREESKEREKQLMDHLEKSNETLTKIAVTLDKMDNRICNLEKKSL